MSDTTECPGCRTQVDADEKFCPTCDEPIAWRAIEARAHAEPRVATVAAAPTVDDGRARPVIQEAELWTHGRQPEVYGRTASSKVECWNCRENNPPPDLDGFTTCRLCGKTIPKPVPPQLPEQTAGSSTSPKLVTVRRRWEVPDKLLVASGALAAGLAAWLTYVLF